MLQYRRQSFQELTLVHRFGSERFIADDEMRLPLLSLNPVGMLRGGPDCYRGCNVLIRTHRQFTAVLAALALDGLAQRILLCPAEVPNAQIPDIIKNGEVDVTFVDSDLDLNSATRSVSVPQATEMMIDTEWVLFTSGTSGTPKLVLHHLHSLIAPLGDPPVGHPAVWSTFYDIRRYGGLQILLRALVGGGSMLLSGVNESVASFLTRIGQEAVTHVSGTPSHWRRALMSGAADKMTPSYVRLSGEMASQDILDRLHEAYPQAQIEHAFASSEAGVAFKVDDGRAGFPESILQFQPPKPQIRIQEGTIRIRSAATAMRYLGLPSRCIIDEEGFVDTGDLVELKDGRFYFVGRAEGVVNVGGQKVYPEEIETIINKHPDVLMSRVWGRHSPITGTLIAADVVLENAKGRTDFSCVKAEIIESCRAELAPYKVPVRITEVAEIPVMMSGKIERRHA